MVFMMVMEIVLAVIIMVLMVMVEIVGMRVSVSEGSVRGDDGDETYCSSVFATSSSGLNRSLAMPYDSQYLTSSQKDGLPWLSHSFFLSVPTPFHLQTTLLMTSISKITFKNRTREYLHFIENYLKNSHHSCF